MLRLPHRSFLPLALIITISIQLVVSVNHDKYNNLRREEFLKLDRDVTEYFWNDFEELDQLNSSYDEILYDSLRSIRHTVVLNMFDHKYTNQEIMRKSQGLAVDYNKCLRDLAILNQISLDMANEHRSSENVRGIVPPSAINFLESNGKVEAGVLNGNFIWWGSISSCHHGLIEETSVRRYLESKGLKSVNASKIQGRFCFAHLRAKSWPKDDKYFGDRLSLKVAVCLPETCHSFQYFESDEMRGQVDHLTRNNLVPPYNGDRYSVDYLFCFPDEDSEFRQWDLGTKLFVVFILFWTLLTIYTNYKYHKRARLMKDIDEYDVRMVINQERTRQSIDSNRTSSDDRSRGSRSQPVFKQQIHPPTDSVGTQVDDGTSSPSLKKSLVVPYDVSPGQTPAASDIEENDGEFNVIRPIVVEKKLRRHSKAHTSTSSNLKGGTGKQQASETDGDAGLDLFQAFSICANLNFLFSSKVETTSKMDTNADNRAPSTRDETMKRLSLQLSAINRRSSESNEVMLAKSKQYEEQEAEATNGGQGKRTKRVHIDVLDGIKVLATAYIIGGHSMMFFYGAVVDLRFADERMLDFEMVSLLNSLQVVSLFYIITGILFTYLAFSRMKGKQLLRPSFWFVVIIGRYIRLMPNYLLVFWFVRHVAPYTGSGPHWYDYRTDVEHHRGFCATESWWTMLTMSAADIKIPYDCIPQTWYLSNDFRTLLALPFYIALLVYNQTAGYVAIISTMFYSTWKLKEILKLANIDYQIILYWQPHVYSLMADRLHEVYTDLPTRMSTYLLGVMVGHMLYLYETRRIRDWPPWLRTYGLKIAIVLALSLFFGAPILSFFSLFLPEKHEVNSETAVILIPLFKTLMEICISLALMLLVTGGGYKFIHDILTSKLAGILSRISYGAFLIHVEVMYKMPSNKFEADWSFLYLYVTFFIVVSSVIAFFMYVLYEMPINNLLRYVLKKALKSVNG